MLMILVACQGDSKIVPDIPTEDSGIVEPSDESIVDTAIEPETPELYFPPIGESTWETVDPVTQYPNWQSSEVTELLDFLENKNTKAFIVLSYGRIVMEHYLNGHSQQTPWYWASAGKVLTATMTGIAEGEGLIVLDEPVSLYLGEGWTSTTPTQEGLISNRHLLTMTSGLDEYQGTSVEPEDLLYRSDAGTQWGYHNVYRKLQDVIATATGEDWESYFEQKIRDPIGMTGRWTMIDDYSVYLSNARSMARFGLLAFNQGRWEQTSILNASFFGQAASPSQDINKSYGYLWWINGQESHRLPYVPTVFEGSLIPSGPPDMFMALGKNDQKIYVVPSLGMVVIRMGDAADDVNFALSNFDNDLWEQLALVIGERW